MAMEGYSMSNQKFKVSCEVCSVSYHVQFDHDEIEDTPSYCVFCGTVLNDEETEDETNKNDDE